MFFSLMYQIVSLYFKFTPKSLINFFYLFVRPSEFHFQAMSLFFLGY